jgi:RNA polymerase sigma-70 factor, ECF subfamily
MRETAMFPSATSGDDASLALLARVDPEAFGTLYDRFVESIYRFCLRRLGSPVEAEDATAQVFTKALASIAGFRGGSFQGWLFAIANHVVIDTYRAKRNHLSLEDAYDQIDPQSGPEETAVFTESARAVRQVLSQLPVEQRRIYELRLAGLNSLEIARVVGRSHGAIRNVQHRTLAHLRELLGDPSLDAERGRSHGK